MKKFLEKRDFELLNKRLFLIEVKNNETIVINDKKVTFFDICSKKAKQFGFQIEYEENHRLTCCGDEPFNKLNKQYLEKLDWLIHEAFCLKSEDFLYKPYEKNHSTVADACAIAEKFKVKNLVLYHSIDKNIENRKESFLSEGEKIFKGKLFVPYDLEIITL